MFGLEVRDMLSLAITSCNLCSKEREKGFKTVSQLGECKLKSPTMVKAGGKSSMSAREIKASSLEEL